MQEGSRPDRASLSSVSVQMAIHILGNGLLSNAANGLLRQKLRAGVLSSQDYYAQVLRFVYRLIVLFVAEDRGILFPPSNRRATRNGSASRYSTARLRRLAVRHSSTHRSNLYHDLCFVMEKLASASDYPEQGLPVLPRLLFSNAFIPDLVGCGLDNYDALECVRCLIFCAEQTNRRAIDYSKPGAVELGSIYESLLEMRPVVNADATGFHLTFASSNARKTSGSYYTPHSVIDCLLDAVLEPTLAETCTRPDPQKAILNLKVCDPACGSGLFLIAAAKRMARRLATVRAGDAEPEPEICQEALHNIVSNCIYGVDIDPMAVELCKISLWLEVRATEPGEVHSELDAHIRCGNSLLGVTPALLVEGIPDEALQDQFFHWHRAFPDVFSVSLNGEKPENEQAGWSGGFDVVLGNPPYIFGEHLPIEVKQWLPAKFALARGQYDTCWLFVEESLKLVNGGGRCALVVPDTLLARDETSRVRELLLQAGLERLYYCGTAFKANVSTVIFAVTKGSAAREVHCEEIANGGSGARVHSTCSRDRFWADPQRRFLTHLSDEEAQMLARVEAECTPLHTLVKISRGEEIGKKDVLVEGLVPIVVGEDIARYCARQPTRFIEVTRKDAWRYAAPKIIMLKTGYRCVAALDTVGYVTMQSVYNVHITRPEIAYETLLALLNSRFVHWFVYTNFTSYKGLFPQLNQSTIQAIPVPRDLGNQQNKLVKLAQEMLCLKKAAPGESFQQVRIASIEREINRVIYALYGLTQVEIAAIEQVFDERSSQV